MAAINPATAGTYAVDPSHTNATFEANHYGTSTNRGRFGKVEGTVQFDRQARTGAVNVSIDMLGLSTGTAAFDKHLQSPDFFNVALHPSVKFSGDKLSFNGDKVAEVSGVLTMLGKTHPVTLKAIQFNCYTNPMLKREVCGGDFEATIDRTQWGMDYGVNYGITKSVRIVIQVEAIAQ
ncbi:MAG: YceI family protein [Rhodoferax sp.]|nr:YceI family protein [Rhodoferax sp.]